MFTDMFTEENMNNLVSEVNMITPRIMSKIDWRKVRQLKFKKGDDSNKYWSLLVIPLWKKTCYIYFKVSEEDKKELEKMDLWEATEDFITKQLINRGRNGYFNDSCPECEQLTLTKLPIVGSYREAMTCAFCDWAGSLEKYLNYKKENPPLSYSEWLAKGDYRI